MPARNVDSPIGVLGLRAQDGCLTGIIFGGTEPAPGCEDALDAAQAQLREYFAGARRRFDLPLRMQGTDFQLRVWRALAEIPYGQTRSYADIAAQIGSPKACRAVGMANHENPIPIIIPCHRVVGKGGGLTGYAGGLGMKQFLLELEKNTGE